MPTDNRASFPTPRALPPGGAAIAGLLACLAVAAPASAQLREDQVLVVYDGRIADSLAVAEYYAGSSLVPGGVGTRPGIHPGVKVLNIASLPGGGVFPAASDITYATFASAFREPLKAHLNSAGLIRSIRSIVLTKGLPHRILDNTVPGAGDQPGQAASEFNNADATYASVDSELCLLWQNLDSGESGGGGDSRSDGCIINPYFKSSSPINGFSTLNIVAGKNILPVPGAGGQIWRTTPSGTAGTTPGDIYLVCRLDGLTTADVFASIDRAQNLTLNLDTAIAILDEANADGVQNTSDADGELDNDGPTAYTNAGDDYEQTRDLLVSDTRWLGANIRYNQFAGAAQFLVGPLTDYGPGNGLITTGPIALLASYGANHAGVPAAAATTYAGSFTYAPGAVFNTIESYNGRAFGGLGTGPVAQEQLSDFLAAGGTFGIGNVQEPFSISVGDNLAIVRNFFLGNMSWGEAAYTALPVISWQQIVVGDPLARIRRTKEDINADGINSIEDLYRWYEQPASRVDLNRSGAADNTDALLLAASLRSGEQAMMRPLPQLR